MGTQGAGTRIDGYVQRDHGLGVEGSGQLVHPGLSRLLLSRRERRYRVAAARRGEVENQLVDRKIALGRRRLRGRCADSDGGGDPDRQGDGSQCGAGASLVSGQVSNGEANRDGHPRCHGGKSPDRQRRQEEKTEHRDHDPSENEAGPALVGKGQKYQAGSQQDTP